jgi:hypothetical protein
MGTILDCLHLKLNLRKRTLSYSTTERRPNKILKTFVIEDIFHLPPVRMKSVVHLELPIAPQICEKNRNKLIEILRGLGETDS